MRTRVLFIAAALPALLATTGISGSALAKDHGGGERGRSAEVRRARGDRGHRPAVEARRQSGYRHDRRAPAEVRRPEPQRTYIRDSDARDYDARRRDAQHDVRHYDVRNDGVRNSVRNDGVRSYGARPETYGIRRDYRSGYPVHYWPSRVIERRLPTTRVSLWVGGDRFFFCDGRFYRPATYGYAWVAAPLGARIPRLPFGFTVVFYAGRPYYYCEGAYYIHDRLADDYVVVSPPPYAGDFDVITMTDGSSLTGHYLGGDEWVIHFEVGGAIYDVDRESVLSLRLA